MLWGSGHRLVTPGNSWVPPRFSHKAGEPSVREVVAPCWAGVSPMGGPGIHTCRTNLDSRSRISCQSPQQEEAPHRLPQC